MFNVTEIKNKNRHRTEEKAQPIPYEQLFERSPDENKPMPYFEVVPEQFLRDARYQGLNNSDQGMFLRLALHIQGQGMGGMFQDFDPGMAQSMRVTAKEWCEFKGKLLEAGLLVKAPDEIHIVQPELREQCLQYAKQKKRTNIQAARPKIEQSF